MAPRCFWTETTRSCPSTSCLRLVVPDIVRIAKAKLPVVEVLEERPAKRRAVEPAPGKPQAPPAREAKKDDLWEVVEEGSTTAPSTEAEVPEPTEQPVTNEPAVSQDRAQDLLLSGKEVWAATVSGRMVLFQYVRAAIWGARQPDIVAKLINPQEADVVAAWSQDRGLPRILLQEQEEIYVSAQFLQAHCTKLSLQGSPRDGQRERSRSPRRCKHAAEEEQAEAAQPAEDVEMPDAKVEEAEPAAVAEPESALPDADAKPAEEPEHKPADAKPAEDAKPKRCLENQHREQGLVGEIRGKWLELYLDDKAIYDDARVRVESGFLDGWVLDCEMILDSSRSSGASSLADARPKPEPRSPPGRSEPALISCRSRTAPWSSAFSPPAGKFGRLPKTPPKARFSSRSFATACLLGGLRPTSLPS